MTIDKGIVIKNIYYMLSYVFQILKEDDYVKIATETFENVEDLLTAILVKGISRQLKQGLHREYIAKRDDLTVLRGKLDMQGTIRNIIGSNKRLSCEFDELSQDNIYNQILKTTMYYLSKCENIGRNQKLSLKRLLLYFDEITTLKVSEIRWNSLRYHRNNKNYELLLNVSYFILHDLLQTTEDGKHKMMLFSFEQMEKLFEVFLYEYYRKHHGKYLSCIAKQKHIAWDLQCGKDSKGILFLPEMNSDVFLQLGNKILILDAKYYEKAFQEHYGVKKWHSNNIYQIYAYVKNQDKDDSGNVAGMLVYAKTSEDMRPDGKIKLGNSTIEITSIDLDTDFTGIRRQLDKIVEDYFESDVGWL